jgi:hypothetical protein
MPPGAMFEVPQVHKYNIVTHCLLSATYAGIGFMRTQKEINYTTMWLSQQGFLCTCVRGNAHDTWNCDLNGVAVRQKTSWLCASGLEQELSVQYHLGDR